MTLRLIRVFGQAILVGAPTPGLRRFGVPPGGPFDRESWRLATALARAATAWEIVGSADLVAERDGVVALSGAPVAATVDGRERATNARWLIREGEVVRLVAARAGTRSYLAGGASATERRLADLPTSLSPGPIRVLSGPDRVELPLPGWTVSGASNRLGLRLEGSGVPHSIELPSRPTTVGSVQVTPSGMPILLGPDGPTIGGYPQAAVVADADLDRLGQLSVGQAVEFEWITPEQARLLRQEAQKALTRRLAALSVIG